MNDRIQASKKGTKTVYLRVGLWYSEREHAIHITAPGVDDKFHTWVTNKSDSERCHKSLYNHLKRILVSQDRWPDPDPDGNDES